MPRSVILHKDARVGLRLEIGLGGLALAAGLATMAVFLWLEMTGADPGGTFEDGCSTEVWASCPQSVDLTNTPRKRPPTEPSDRLGFLVVAAPPGIPRFPTPTAS